MGTIQDAREDVKFGTMHGSIMDALETVDRAVIYGLSLDPLDAELLQTLESGWRVPENPKSSKLRKVHIVNPVHELVAEGFGFSSMMIGCR